MANFAFQVSGAFEGNGKFAFQGAQAASNNHYGVTAGPRINASRGVVHLNAHGVGGNQTNNDGLEGIPIDDPQ